jgi:hypothetical protein
MKKLISTLALIFVCMALFAQKDSVIFKYCDLVTTKRIASSRCLILADSGQVKTGGLDSYLYRDPNGVGVSFNSPTDALNFMISKGWDLFQVYSESLETTCTIHYLLRRRVK